MNDIFSHLNRYRILRRQTFKQFSSEIGLDETVVRRALIGETDPHDYNKIMFERYYEKNKMEIVNVLLNNEPVSTKE
jgi:hypothetical protein